MQKTAGAADPALFATKFSDPDWTAKGEKRASVPFSRLETLWINTGSLCNIACRSCYIESSPTNDRLVYLTRSETAAFLDEALSLGTREIGFTGGEPFLNPDIVEMLDDALSRGFDVLVLTNAMKPMRRPRVQAGLLDLRDRFADRLTLRVSLDHFTRALHETERGSQTWESALDGLDWLSREGFRIAIAGRMCWGESEAAARTGYRALAAARGWTVNCDDPKSLVLFPEMEPRADVPEITTDCWDILGKRPESLMCATSRMVVKRRGASAPVVLPCTLLPYDLAFEMGATLAEASLADGGMFAEGATKLCHVNCAKFCVLGGGSCS